MSDPIFDEEQAHLKMTYEKIERIEHDAQEKLSDILRDALNDRDSLLDEYSLDRDSEIHVESMAELESINRIMDDYNLSADVTTETLRNAQILLKQPYFAKISLRFKPGAEPKDIYIGSTGMTDDDYRHFIVDWRSPVAEVYYNQENGKTSYTANDRTIDVDLELRRQFDIEGSKLNAYFDTTVAIQDKLLLASLSKKRSSHLTAITTTIQKEQNEVIRHEDVPALLVHGIAGSGKTSVLLQRIAYLFYQQRETLSPEDVYLITPNPVFKRYIENVLPELGELNPESTTWDELMETLGLASRGVGDISVHDLDKIDETVPQLRIRTEEFADIKVGSEVVVNASQARSSWEKLKRFEPGTHRSSLVAEALLDKLEQKIKRMAASEATQNALMDLDEDTQLEVFGEYLAFLSMDEAELKSAAEKYLRWLYRGVDDRIESGEWLNIDKIGMRMLKKESMDSVEWLYLKLALAGGNNRSAKYVVIDEVQDYTASQLKVMARYFCNAHFLMLGDENQAIRKDTASFAEIKDLFERARGSVSECALMTSYRSSPEITEVFASLLPENQRLEAQSVQRPGTPVDFFIEQSDTDYEAHLIELADEAQNLPGLTAFIAPNKQRMNQLSHILGEQAVTLSSTTGALPDQGAVLLNVKLAKGLEFDNVIVCDADSQAYPDDSLARHRLYTAISRATQRVSLVAREALSPMLTGFDK